MSNFLFRKLSFVSALLIGCAGGTGGARVQQLNDLTRSIPQADVATFTANAPPRLFETQEKSGLVVSYNITHVVDSGITLRIVFRNNRSEKLVIQPKVTLTDAAGFVVDADTYAYKIETGSRAAQTPVPQVLIASEAPTTSFYNSGTIRSNTTGNTYSYSGYSAPAGGGFASGFAAGSAAVERGFAIRRAREAAEQIAAGREMLKWVNAFWLRNSYELESQAAAAGVLTFTERPLSLPLRVRIDAGGNRYEFFTGSGSAR